MHIAKALLNMFDIILGLFASMVQNWELTLGGVIIIIAIIYILKIIIMMLQDEVE